MEVLAMKMNKRRYELTDEEWAKRVAIRKAWRAEINELELVFDQTEVKDMAA